jgi:hypothetical protein
MPFAADLALGRPIPLVFGRLEQTMSETTHSLVLDFVEWVAARPRTYAEVMEAWRTSCPRLTIWEDSIDQKLVAREHRDGVAIVTVTALGRVLLQDAGRLPVTTASPVGR